MPVIGVPESLRPAIHMLLEDPILDLVIGLHREGFSSSWSPLSGDSPLLKISKFPIKTLWACLSSPSSSPAVPNLDKTINPLHSQLFFQQSCLLLKSMFPMMRRERGCLKTLKSHVFVKDIPALAKLKRFETAGFTSRQIQNFVQRSFALHILGNGKKIFNKFQFSRDNF